MPLAQSLQEARNQFEHLVERFHRNVDAYKHTDYKEEKARVEFINPFFEGLGWDVRNTKGYAEPYKDVIHEDAIRLGISAGAPDYCFRIGGTHKFFLEAKKPSVSVEAEIGPAYQLRRCAWSAKLPLSILTDFEEFAVHDCQRRPKPSDKAGVARVQYVTYDEYLDEFDDIASECIVFTFSDMGTFFTIAMLAGEADLFAVKGLPQNVEVLYHSESRDQIRFTSWVSKAGGVQVRVTMPGAKSTYTRTIARRTIIRIKAPELFVIPLPHPSPAKAQSWPKESWRELEWLIRRVPVQEAQESTGQACVCGTAPVSREWLSAAEARRWRRPGPGAARRGQAGPCAEAGAPNDPRRSHDTCDRDRGALLKAQAGAAQILGPYSTSCT